MIGESRVGSGYSETTRYLYPEPVANLQQHAAPIQPAAATLETRLAVRGWRPETAAPPAATR